MPIHDWTRVDAGIFHHFHQSWIGAIQRALNAGLLPPDHYALIEQHAGKFEPDVVTLKGKAGLLNAPRAAPGRGGVRTASPRPQFVAEADLQFYRRKQSSLAIRHVSDDEVVAIVEVVSPANKAGRKGFNAFIEKACSVLGQSIHLLVLDLQPPTKRDPRGIHAAIWDELGGGDFVPPADKPLTLVSYETDLTVRAYIDPVAVGDVLPDVPLFLAPGAHVPVPTEETYRSAWADVPDRWRRVIEG